MPRSIWKGPFIDKCLISKLINYSNEELKKNPIKTWSRRSFIIPEFCGLNFEIHNGKTFYPLTITESMVGHKLGEFSSTRKLCVYTKTKKKKKS
uniref:Small ribosomal subunit protein uS19c n=1 Tax=Eukaryota sp. BB2 TaxID=1949062 RepID=A0A1X8VEX2_9EUKA|nr:ribosomal protein S19 [Eukaryota sp. BB2]AQL10442.1 ribosomal protein S19 [Eukaryota sp. BB2]